MFKRIFLMLAVNLAIIVTISIILSVLGIDTAYLKPNGIDYTALMIFCLMWGMVGSFISLLLSKKMVKWTMGVKIIDPASAYGSEADLVTMVHALAKKAELPKMPEVGIYSSPEVNAFATGPSKSNSLVAVSEGLLDNMSREEVEGVLAHEVAHIANGDMVTMTLVQGVVNAFVMFFARIAAFAVQQFLRGDDEESGATGGLAYYITTFLFEILFGIIGMIVVAYVSRRREFKADAGGAYLAGKDKMRAALQRLQQNYAAIEPAASGVATLKISGTKSKFLSLFSTHPDLSDRIEALR